MYHHISSHLYSQQFGSFGLHFWGEHGEALTWEILLSTALEACKNGYERDRKGRDVPHRH